VRSIQILGRAYSIPTIMAAFAVMGFIAVVVPSGTSFAATKTWVGTDCPTTDCYWSNGNNWQGGAAPVNGDDIVITSNAVTPDAFDGTLNDISNLSVKNIAVSGYAKSANSYMTISNTIGNATALTITGNVTYVAPVVAAPSGWYAAERLAIDHNTITLGADSIFTQVSFTASNTLNLNGHALTYIRTLGDGAGTTVGLSPTITGNGTLNIDVPLTTALFMKGVNTYSGVTNINTVDYVNSSDVPNVAMFGTSVVNLSSQGRILFEADGAQAINNTINVTPPTVSGTFLSNQLEFWSGSAAVTYTVPNLHLLGNARFGVNVINGAVTVNLAGIVVNGHCVQYGDGNGQAANFLNGPSACVVNVSGTPATPNTGAQIVFGNPIVVGVLGLAAAATVVFLARRTAKN